MNDRCVACGGEATLGLLAAVAAKLGVLVLCAKFLEKATRRTYTVHIAFAAVVFTAQTCGLAVSDSYGATIREDSPAVASMFDGMQYVLNPDKHTPEVCVFGDSLPSKLILEAVLPLLCAFLILTAISTPWHACEFSCGLRPCCNARRAFMERIKARLARKKLSASWDGDVLVNGTLALVQKETVVEREQSNDKKHSITLAASDRAKVLLALNSIPGPHLNDFENLSARQLRRLLRSLNMPTSLREEKAELVRRVQFAVDCEDKTFDSEPLPDKLERWQLTQAYLLVLVYFYAPCTRALEQLLMCRTLGGSGDSADPEPHYQPRCKTEIHIMILS